MPNSYDIGTDVLVTVTFTDVNGNPANPTTVTIKALDPLTKAVVVGTVTQVSTGVYQAVFTPESSGRWAYRAQGTGALNAAFHGEFLVNVQEIS